MDPKAEAEAETERHRRRRKAEASGGEVGVCAIELGMILWSLILLGGRGKRGI